MARVFRSGREGQKSLSERWEVRIQPVIGIQLWRCKEAPKPSNTSSIQKLEKAGKWTLQKAPRKEHSPANTLILAPVDSSWTFDFQSCRLINLCCLKWLSLWEIATSARGEESSVFSGFVSDLCLVKRASAMEGSLSAAASLLCFAGVHTNSWPFLSVQMKGHGRSENAWGLSH